MDVGLGMNRLKTEQTKLLLKSFDDVKILSCEQITNLNVISWWHSSFSCSVTVMKCALKHVFHRPNAELAEVSIPHHT